MNKYRVYVQQVVSHYIDVEADNREDAAEQAMYEGLPGLMFLDHRYPDEGMWDISTYDGEEQIELLEGEEPPDA